MTFLCAPWKLATGGIAALTLVLSGLLVSTYFENRNLIAQSKALSREINDPKTGYVVRLAQQSTNVETLKAELNSQRESFQIKEAERNAVLAETTRKLEAAQANTRKMQVQLDRFMSTKPQGATLEDRIRDIDERAMSEFVQ